MLYILSIPSAWSYAQQTANDFVYIANQNAISVNYATSNNPNIIEIKWNDNFDFTMGMSAYSHFRRADV